LYFQFSELFKKSFLSLLLLRKTFAHFAYFTEEIDSVFSKAAIRYIKGFRGFRYKVSGSFRTTFQMASIGFGSSLVTAQAAF
jgi:hypothetical protein